MTNPGHRSRSVHSLLLVGTMLSALALPATAQSVSAPLATPDTLACAPRLAPGESTPVGLVVGAPDIPQRRLFGQGDVVVLSVGRAEGISVGTQFFARRVEEPSDAELRARGIRNLRTSGWLRALDVDEHSALAVVERSCSEIRRGDQLAPFQWPAAVSPLPVGSVDYDDPAAVLFGVNGGSMSGTGQMLVIDQGADRQIARGQRLTIYRAAGGPGAPVTEIGQAVAVLVDSTSSTVQLIDAREPVLSGDLVAAHR